MKDLIFAAQILLTLLTFLIFQNSQAQKDTTWQEKPALEISGFLDVFYVYDFNRPAGTSRQHFLFNHNRHNEFNVNLGIVKFGLQHTKYRANLALQSGTYANDNYAAEPGLLKMLFEANVGLALNSQNSLWIDAGVLPSHIGFEGAISSENWTLTRSILAENSPYFLTGAKLTYQPNKNLEIAALVVNGWQRIQRLPGNSLPSFGTQVHYLANDKVTLNWSTISGTNFPDSTRRMRYFNNFYGQFELSKKWGLIAGFDFGLQQSFKGSENYDFWLSPVLICQYEITRNWHAAFRMEYYADPTEIKIHTQSPNGFQTSGFSLNLDYSPTPNVLCRLECRWLNSKDAIFEFNNSSSHNNFILATSMAVQFSK